MVKSNKALQYDSIRQDIENMLHEAVSLGYTLHSAIEELENDMDIDQDILKDIITDIAIEAEYL